MAKKKKQKAFTLVELLVAISIVGIIVLVAIPTLNGIIEEKNKKTYQKYSDSLVSGAKLYADSYDVDLFGRHPSGCMQVDMDTLKKKNLVKDVQIKNSDCNTEDTYVIVKKVNGKYQYQQQLKCVNKNSKTLYEQKITSPICTEESSHSGPKITLENPKDGWITTDKAYVSIKIEDIDGLLQNNEVKYMWSRDEAGTNIVFEKNLNFGNDLDDKTVTKKVSRPKEDGKFYLIVQPINVVDVFGNYTTKKEVKGQYKFDSHAPECATALKLKSESTPERTWTNQNITFTFEFADEVAAYEWITYKDGEKNESSDNLRNLETNVIETTKSLKSTGVRTYTIKIRDEAGNTSKCESGKDYYIDKNNPTCTITPDDTEKWYTSAVELKVKSNDDLSGIASSNLTTSTTATYINNTIATQTTDTDGQKWYGYVKDNAGNVGKCSTSVKVDTTAPTCEIVVSEGTTGDNGWYKSNVKLSLTTKDETSGIGKKYDLTKSSTASYEGTTTGTQSDDTKGKKWYGYVKDKAGNIGKCDKTIKKDTVKPTCTVNKTGTEGLSSWYTSNVSLSLTDSDETSGIISRGITTSTTADYNGNTTGSQTKDTTGVIWYGYVKDAAGNAKTCETTIKKDATQPGCDIKVTSGSEGTESWYRSNVALSLTPSDTTSGVKGSNLTTSSTASFSGTLTGTQTEDTSGKKWYGYVKDNAGNTKKCEYTVKKDTTKPTCEVEISSGTAGEESWYRTDIGLKLTTSDNASGVSGKTLTTSTTASYGNTTTGTQNTDTSGTKWNGYVKDKAGNTNSCSKTVKRDTTGPTCSVTVSSGTKGDNDWYTTDVGIQLNQSDERSGVIQKGLAIEANPTNGKTSNTQTANTTRTWYGRVKDKAGNVTTCSKVVKKDAQKPSCSISITSGTEGKNSYYKSDIGLKMSPSDEVSGIAKKGFATSSGSTNGNTTGTQTSDTTGTTWYGYVKDNAGNTNSCSKTVYKDTKAPYIVEKVSYDAGKCTSFRGSNLQHNTVIHRIKIIFQDDTSGITDILYKYEYDDSTPDGSYITEDTLYLSRSNTIVLSRNKHNRLKRVRQDYNLTVKEDAWFKFKLVDRAGNSVVTASQKANYDGSPSSKYDDKYCRQAFPELDAYATLRKNYYYGTGDGNAGKCMTDDATYCYLVPDDGK